MYYEWELSSVMCDIEGIYMHKTNILEKSQDKKKTNEDAKWNWWDFEFM